MVGGCIWGGGADGTQVETIRTDGTREVDQNSTRQRPPFRIKQEVTKQDHKKLRKPRKIPKTMKETQP